MHNYKLIAISKCIYIQSFDFYMNLVAFNRWDFIFTFLIWFDSLSKFYESKSNKIDSTNFTIINDYHDESNFAVHMNGQFKINNFVSDDFLENLF